MDISARRADIEAELAELRRQQASEYLDNGKPSKAQGTISRLQNELSTLDQAEGLLGERARAEAERQRQTRLANLRAKIALSEKARLDGIAEAEAATRALLAAWEKVRGVSREIAKLAPHVELKSVGGGLSPTEFERRMGRYTAAVLAQYDKKRKHFGHISFPWTGYDSPDLSWLEAEMKVTDHDYRLIFGKPCPHHQAYHDAKAKEQAQAEAEPKPEVLQITHQPQENLNDKPNNNNGGKWRR